MHLINRPSGRFHNRLWIEDDEFDVVALRTLDANQLFPETPSPVNIELLVERLFPCAYEFSHLDKKLMGRIAFGPHGPISIEIDHRLDRPDNELINRRCRSTLGHECGHGVLHSCLFKQLWREGPRPERGIILCDNGRNLDDSVTPNEERWFEYQANRMMASLLLPLPLVIACIGDQYLEPDRYLRLSPGDRMSLAGDLQDAFDVSRTLANYRLQDIFGKVFPRLISIRDRGTPPTYETLNLCWPNQIFGQSAA